MAFFDKFKKEEVSTVNYDEDLEILYMNKTFLKKFGKKAISKKCYRIYKDNKKQCEKCPLKKPIRVGQTKTVITPGVAGGRTFKISHTGLKLPNGKKVILEFFEDITGIKNAKT